MSSNANGDFDLERDLPLTAADIEALDRARRLPPLATAAYLDWLTLMWRREDSPSHLNTDADEPFTL